MNASCDAVSGDTFLAQRLREFYTPDVIRNILIPLLKQNGTVSLRTLDWLVTNYSKKFNVVCKAPDGKYFNIYNGYKVSLSVYRRRYFDPFRRRERHNFTIDGETYETTIGQANFIYWAYTNGVLQYAYEHAKSIEADMNSFSNAHKSKLKEMRRNGIVHKRTSLSRATSVKCHVYRVPSCVNISTDDSLQ